MSDRDTAVSIADRARPTLVVTRVTLRQLFRKQRGSPLLLGVIVGANLFLTWTLVGVSGTGAYDLGLRLAAGNVDAVVSRIRRTALSGLVLVSVMHTLGAASDGRLKHQRVSFLTATSTGAVVVALLFRRSVASLVLFGPALVAAAVAFAVGAGTPVSALSLGFGSLWLVVLTAVITLPLGLAANWVVAGYDLSSNARVGLGAAVLGVFYLALFNRDAIGAALGRTPVAWAGDLLLVTVPGSGASVGAAAAFAIGSIGVVLAVTVLCVRLADAAWYSDPVFGDEDDTVANPPPTASLFATLLESICSPQTVALVALTWRRTKRTPKVLFYVYPSVLVGVVMAEQLVVHGPFSSALYPVIVAFTGAIALGSGFTLNPLGTEGDALPAILTAGAGSDRLVRAKALGAALVGGPLVLGLAIALGLAVGAVPVILMLSVVGYAFALVTLAPLLSQALGVHYPPDHEELLGGSVKVPNKSASFLYTVGMVAVGLPGFAGLGHFALSNALDPLVLVAGVGITIIVAVPLAWFSYRHATSQLAAYSIE